MGDLAPVAAAVVLALLGFAGTWYSGRKLRKLGLGADQQLVNATLRELADSWEAKYELEHEAHLLTRADLATERAARRLCEGDLDDLRSTVRERKRGAGVRGQP